MNKNHDLDTREVEQGEQISRRVGHADCSRDLGIGLRAGGVGETGVGEKVNAGKMMMTPGTMLTRAVYPRAKPAEIAASELTMTKPTMIVKAWFTVSVGIGLRKIVSMTLVTQSMSMWRKEKMARPPVNQAAALQHQSLSATTARQ